MFSGDFVVVFWMFCGGLWVMPSHPHFFSKATPLGTDVKVSQLTELIVLVLGFPEETLEDLYLVLLFW